MKRTPLRRVSRKRQAMQPAYNEFRQTILERDGHICQFYTYVLDSPDWRSADLANVPARCSGVLEVHHIIPRSTWPEGVQVESNCATLCSLAHHPWVTDNPEKAHRVGLHGFSWERPS